MKIMIYNETHNHLSKEIKKLRNVSFFLFRYQYIKMESRGQDSMICLEQQFNRKALFDLKVKQKINTFVHNIQANILRSDVPPLRPFVEQTSSIDNKEQHAFKGQGILVLIILLLLLITQLLQISFFNFYWSYDTFRQIQSIRGLLGISLFQTLCNSLSHIIFSSEVDGLVETRLKPLAYNYLTGYFLVDIAKIIFILLIIALEVPWLALVTYILTLIELYETSVRLRINLVDSQYKGYFYKLASTFLLNLIIAQSFTLIFNSMAMLQPTNNWLTKYGIQNNVWSQKFYYSFYYSMTTLTTVGYGDITVSNPQEALIVSFCELVGGIMFAYNIGSIGSIIASISSRNQELERNARTMISMFNRYSKRLQDPSLRTEVLNEVKNQTSIQNQVDLHLEERILTNLETNLRNKLLMKLHLGSLNALPLFNKFNLDTRKDLTSIFKREILSNGQAISPNQNKLYVVQRGKVIRCINIREPIEQQILQASKESPILLGIKKFLTWRPDQFLYRVAGNCQIFSLDTCELINKLKQESGDYQKLLEMLHRSRYNTDFPYQQECSLCKVRHNINRCPKYHYAPIKELHNTRYLLKSQARTHLNRRRKEKETIFKKNYQGKGIGKLQEQEFNFERLHSLREMTEGIDLDSFMDWKYYNQHSNIAQVLNKYNNSRK